ncbi:MAG TPA: M14 family zinc carboxypeptidase [Terriglobales bacterium]|nr:M14 family zinc carboxypeptidase [Terriglobales bacterium]
MRSSQMKLRFLSLAVCFLIVISGICTAQKSACKVTDHVEYGKKIKEYTTESFFITELVDHLPQSSCVPSPDTFLKRVVGAPDKLTYVADINAYMRLLASKSPRVKVTTIGKSEEGREMLLVTISDESNLAKVDRYREITARLADPRGLNEAEAQKLIAEGKPMYWAAGSIHSPETASPELQMELAYRLAVDETPFIQKIRRDSIVMLTPVVETDGRDRMVDLYHYRKAHPDAQQYPLTWWGHYVAHDNNRDGMTLSLALSRNMMKTFLDWHPTVFHDLHESVPYLYISTGTGPYNAWLDPIVIGEWQQMAYHEVEEMTKRGIVGVWTHGFYDGWAPNYMFYLANGHNSIGRFYETFGNGGADTRVRTLPPTSTSREWFRPNPPLAKVKWSLRNNINMAQSALLFGMHNVATRGPQFLQNFYIKSKRSVEKARKEGPAAWVLPSDDPRPVEQARLINLFKLQGVEVQKVANEIKVGEAKYPAGSYVIRMDQPYSRMADMMLDTQYYSPRDPRSYDDTGWTLGALRNVKTARVTETSVLDAPMVKVDGDVRPTGAVTGQGKNLILNHNTDNTLATLRFQLPKQKMEAAEAAFELDGKKFRAGSFILRDADVSAVGQHAKDLGLQMVATDAEIKVKTHVVATPRIALMHTWQSTQNDGWFRIAMDRLEVPYTYIADTKIRETADLRAKFDVILVPPTATTLQAFLRGIPMRGSAMPWKNSDEMKNLVAEGLDSADDIRGGLDYSGLANLEKFVSDGGLMIAVQGATALPIQGGMTDMVSTVEPRTLQAPGSVVVALVEDKMSPIAYGYEDKLHVYFRQGPIFRVSTGFAPAAEEAAARPSGRGGANDADVIQGRQYQAPEKVTKRTPAQEEAYIQEGSEEAARVALPPKDQWPRVVLRFAPEKELLLSGMLVGASELAEKPAVIDVPHGKGHVVLFANNPMWRDETMGSFFLVFNAMMNFDNLHAGR